MTDVRAWKDFMVRTKPHIRICSGKNELTWSFRLATPSGRGGSYIILSEILLVSTPLPSMLHMHHANADEAPVCRASMIGQGVRMTYTLPAACTPASVLADLCTSTFLWLSAFSADTAPALISASNTSPSIVLTSV